MYVAAVPFTSCVTSEGSVRANNTFLTRPVTRRSGACKDRLTESLRKHSASQEELRPYKVVSWWCTAQTGRGVWPVGISRTFKVSGVCRVEARFWEEESLGALYPGAPVRIARSTSAKGQNRPFLVGHSATHATDRKPWPSPIREVQPHRCDGQIHKGMGYRRHVAVGRLIVCISCCWVVWRPLEDFPCLLLIPRAPTGSPAWPHCLACTVSTHRSLAGCPVGTLALGKAPQNGAWTKQLVRGLMWNVGSWPRVQQHHTATWDVPSVGPGSLGLSGKPRQAP